MDFKFKIGTSPSGVVWTAYTPATVEPLIRSFVEQFGFVCLTEKANDIHTLMLSIRLATEASDP